MKYTKLLATICAAATLLCSCATPNNENTAPTAQTTMQAVAPTEQVDSAEAVTIQFGDEILVTEAPISNDPDTAVYTAQDIIYYEADKDFTYGAGDKNDAHTPEEAQAHTVVHITKPGTYRLSGRLPKGQIAVDLGKDAKEDPQAVVTLILEGLDITCEVAPAIIFYNVYECGKEDNPTKDVDTSAAGANVVIADSSVNTVRGSYVAKIYKPESIVLNGENTEVVEAKKLHKYDGAFYSRMSMNVSGGEAGNGELNIIAENEGLDSEMHLTVNGGRIAIMSGNDGINTNEDGVSVTTINGGELSVFATGQTGEGDGIDSNGWLVINGGKVIAYACSDSADAGIDSDMGIHINGGTVIATGHMLDRIEDGGQTYGVFSFAAKQSGKEAISLQDEAGNSLFIHRAENAFSILIYSSPELVPGTYTLWSDDTQLAGSTGNFGGGMGRPGMMPGTEGGQRPDGFTPPQDDKGRPQGGFRPEDMEMPEGFTMPEGMERPDGFTPPEGGERPAQGVRPEFGDRQPQGSEPESENRTLSPEFVFAEGGNMFGNIAPVQNSD